MELAKKQITDADFKTFQRHSIFMEFWVQCPHYCSNVNFQASPPGSGMGTVAREVDWEFLNQLVADHESGE